MARPKKKFKTSELVDKPLSEKREEMRAAFFEALKFKRQLFLDEWSDEYRVLPQETSSEHGAWVTQRFPFLRRIMRCLSPSSIAREIIVMKGAQLGFTETAICWLLFIAHYNPGPALYVQKTADAAKDFSTQKLRPSIDAAQALAHVLGKEKSKRFADSWDNKAFPGGFIVMGGANSSAFLRSKSIRDAILDEEDSYESNIDGEGSPVQLIGKRQVNFPDRKRYRVSTPVLKELSTIEPAFEAGSQEYFYVPCPFCNPTASDEGFMFILSWENGIKWSKELDPKTGYPREVWCECPNCAEKIFEEQHKTWLLDKGDWFSTKNPDDEKKPLPRYRVGDVVNPSFHISSLYSPAGFFSWRDAVKEWFDYRRSNDVAALQVFINQTLAQTFSLEGHDLNYSFIASRAESYAGSSNAFDVPQGALVLTAGVDVQDDRFEVEVVGWGMHEENWSIDYAVIMGDTSIRGDRYGMLPDGQPSVWRLLDDYLLKRFKHQSGVDIGIEVAMVDCGYKTEEVHLFCRLRENRRVFAIHGSDGWGKGLFSQARKRHERYGTVDFTAYPDEVKNKIYAQLQIEERGPGYCHFPRKSTYSEKYFKGLVCESKRVKLVNGKKKLYWYAPSGSRNEPLDCRVYAYVAFIAYPVNLEARALAFSGAPRLVNGPQGSRSAALLNRRRGSSGL